MNRGTHSKQKKIHERGTLFLQNLPACKPGFTVKRRDTELQIAASFLIPSVLSPHSAPHCHSPSMVRVWLSHTVTVAFQAAANQQPRFRHFRGTAHQELCANPQHPTDPKTTKLPSQQGPSHIFCKIIAPTTLAATQVERDTTKRHE